MTFHNFQNLAYNVTPPPHFCILFVTSEGLFRLTLLRPHVGMGWGLGFIFESWKSKNGWGRVFKVKTMPCFLDIEGLASWLAGGVP